MVEKALSQISSIFHQIETKIREKFEKKVTNEEEIKKNFLEIKEIMDNKIQVHDKTEYKLLNYVFHHKKSIFFKAFGQESEAQNQEIIAKNYEKYFRKNQEKLKKEKTRIIEMKKYKEINENPDEEEKKTNEETNYSALFTESKEKVLLKTENNELDNLRPLIGENAFKTLDENLKLAKIRPNTFVEYQTLKKIEMSLKTILKEVHLRIKESQNLDDQDSIFIIQKIAQHQLDYGKLEFVRKMLGLSDIKRSLFGDLIKTEEEINKRYRELVLCFHPDKALWVKTDEDKDLIQELYFQISETKNSLMEKLEQHALKDGKIVYYEEKGHKYWERCQDYKNASKGDWHKLKILKKKRNFQSYSGRIK